MVGMANKWYRAVFYDCGVVVNVGPARTSEEEAQGDIDFQKQLYSMFVYLPWTEAKVEEV
jgi:hypothetical protein